MKKRLFLFFLQLGIITFLSAQTQYHKMVVEGNEWKVDAQYCDPFWGCDPQMGLNFVFVYQKLEQLVVNILKEI